MSDPIVIIGTGLAGYVLVREIRQRDAQTAIVMITQDQGEFYHKPKLSAIMGQAPEVSQSASAAEMAKELSLDVRTQQTVTAIDPSTKTLVVNGENFAYRDLILACGAEPIRLPIPGLENPKVMSVNSLDDYRHWVQHVTPKSRIVIIGGGLVGTEFSNDLKRYGCDVTVINLGNPVAQLLPEAIARALKNRLIEQGIDWIGDQPISHCIDQGASIDVILQNGQCLSADHVLLAVGLHSNTALAQAAGLEIDDGIVVNDHGQTNQKHIYAIGDCAQVLGQVRRYVGPIRHLAAAMAQTLTGTPTSVEFPPMPILMKTPLCPTMICLPPKDIEGHWQIEGEGGNLVAKFLDHQGVLRGFSLIGTTMTLRGELLKQVIANHPA